MIFEVKKFNKIKNTFWYLAFDYNRLKLAKFININNSIYIM